MSRRLLTAALLLTPLSACQCDEPIHALQPLIFLTDPDDDTKSPCLADRMHDCAHDFGDVGVGQEKTFAFAIANPGDADLFVDVQLDGPAFSITTPPIDLVEAGAFRVVGVRYAPDAADADEVKLFVVADAANLADDEDVFVTLKGRGVEAAALPAPTPSIAVAPAECDFGDVAVGVRTTCTLSFTNDGDAPLTIESLALSDDTPGVFELEGDTTLVVQAGTSQSVSIAATPADAIAFAGTLVVASDAPAAPMLFVPLRVTGTITELPTAVARIKSVNGAPVAGATGSVRPLDDVVISADQSVGGGGAVITGWAWSIVEQPPESSATLSTPTSIDTGFTFSSAAGDVAGLDVTGTFRVRLVVTDESGGTSTNEAIVAISSVPGEGLHVQLTWSASSNDLDLHLGNGFNINWCSQQDCYYGNCEFEGPNWDGSAGFTAGDPVLDIDDTNGFGPENIRIEQPDGSFLVGVHSYSGAGDGPGFTPTDVTVKIFVGGALVDTYNGHLSAKNQFWRVARVDVTTATPTVTAVDTIADPFNGCN